MTIESVMHAVVMREFGGWTTLRYEATPIPVLGPHDVLVKAAGAGINPVDYKTRKGAGVAGMLGRKLPLILGWDVAGTVAATGAAIHHWPIGTPVYALASFPQEGGCYAEYVKVHVSHLAKAPTSIELEFAAGVPLAALTSWQALFEVAQLQPGERVLIHAAAGGVGHLAVQIAKWAGAHVVGTASARNEAFVRKLGADQFIDYNATPFESVVHDVDVVLDAVGGDVLARSYGVLKSGGRLVSIEQKPDLDLASKAGVKAYWAFVRPDAPQLIRIAELIDEGVIAPLVSITFPLAQASEAHEMGERGHTKGKMVLLPGSK